MSFWQVRSVLYTILVAQQKLELLPDPAAKHEAQLRPELQIEMHHKRRLVGCLDLKVGSIQRVSSLVVLSSYCYILMHDRTRKVHS